MKGFQAEMCPRCGAMKIKSWDDLTGEQKFLVERLPMSAEFSLDERKRHRWCVKCWNEFIKDETNLV